MRFQHPNLLRMLQIEQLKFQQRIHGSPSDHDPRYGVRQFAKQADEPSQAIVNINN